MLGLVSKPIRGEEIVEDWRSFFEGSGRGRVCAPTICYVHIPFCQSKCSFCECTSFTLRSEAQVRRYLGALTREIELMAQLAGTHSLEAMYIGGGTPGLLSETQLSALLGRLLSAFVPAGDFHLCCEMNPRSLTRGKIEVLQRHGCHRVSLGVQSFDPGVLANIGRDYQTADSVARAVAIVRQASTMALNLDLVAGLPGDSLESFEQSVRSALELRPDSLVAYPWLVNRTGLEACGVVAEAHASGNARREELLRAAEKVVLELRPAAVMGSEPFGEFTVRKWLWNTSAATENRYSILKETRDASVLGLGFGAESRIHGQVVVDHGASMAAWEEAVLQGKLPDSQGRRLEPQRARESIAAAPETSAALPLRVVRDAPPAPVCHPALARREALALQLVARCNANCRHCPWQCDAMGDVSTEELMRTLGQSAGQGIRIVNLIGPEPTIDPRMPALVRAARMLGFESVACWSNGRRFAYRRYAETVVEAGMNAAVVSVHGADAASHDALVGTPGAWSQTVSGLSNLVALLGPALVARVVVSNLNLPLVPGILARVENLGVLRVLLDFADDISLRELTRIHQALSRSMLEFSCHYRKGAPVAG